MTNVKLPDHFKEEDNGRCYEKAHRRFHGKVSAQQGAGKDADAAQEHDFAGLTFQSGKLAKLGE